MIKKNVGSDKGEELQARATLPLEAMAQATLNALQAHMAVLDEDGVIVATNSAWDRFAEENQGRPEKVGVGSNYLQVCERADPDPDGVARKIAAAIRALLGGKKEELLFEYPCHSPSEHRWFYCRLSRFVGREGAVRVVVSHENITAIRAMEAELLSTQARFRSAFEQAAVGMVHIAPDGRLIQCNQHFCESLGYAQTDLAQRSIEDITYAEDVSTERIQRRRLCQGEIDSYMLEKRLVSKLGHARWVSVTSSVVRKPEGEIDYLLEVVQDCHLRKLSSQALLALSGDRLGEGFFQRITQMLASLLNVEIGFIGELQAGAARSIHMRAMWADGGPVPSFSFDLDGTPCSMVLGEELRVFPADVRQRFPRFGLLAQWRVESYAAVPLWNADGSPLGLLGIMSRRPFDEPDTVKSLLELVALRVGSELEREREERKFRALLDNLPNAVLMVDGEGMVVFANQASGQLFGWEPEQLTGTVLWNLVPIARRRRYQHFFRRVFKGGTGADASRRGRQAHETLALRRNGSTFVAELSLSFLDTARGPMLMVHVQDVSELRRGQELQKRLNRELVIRVQERTQELEQVNEALSRREEEFRSIVESMVDAVIGIDERGIMVSANSSVTRLLGYTKAELLGQNVSMLMAEPDRSAHDGYLQHYCRTGQARIIGIGRAVQGRHKSGELIALELGVSEFTVRGKRYFTGTLHDIRERLRLINTLEQARQEAEQASRAKSAFLATMSHEIRTPMNGIIGMIEVLQQSSLRKSQVEIVNTIRNSAFALLSIVDDVLDFSKIEAERLQIESVPMDVARVAEEVCDTLDPLAMDKGVELTLFTAPSLPAQSLGDPIRLRQVLLNLVGNAVKFSSGLDRLGQVAVRVRCSESTAEHDMLDLTVADNGIGIDPDSQKNLFTPFTQADSTTTRRFGGTGLGLSIAHRLVEAMGGHIAFQSEPGRGATFTVRLPVQRAPSRPAPSEERAAAEPDLRGLNCLVVGAHDGLAADWLAYLSGEGALARQISSLRRAQQAVKEFPAGVLVCVVDLNHVASEPWRSFFQTESAPDVRFVLVGRGKRRQPRLEPPDTVLLDRNAMHQSRLLQAVGLAAGRLTMAEDDQEGPEEKAPAAAGTLLPRAGARVLIAEDNDINQEVLVRQLQLLGVGADIAGNGREAFERWRRGRYALLFTDLHMPEWDGYELVRAVRKAEAEAGQARLPVIAVTANAIKGEVDHCHEIGMDDYITKPVQLVRLRAVLEKWLAPHNNHQRVAPTEALPQAALPAGSRLDLDVLRRLVGDDPAVVDRFLDKFRTSARAVAAELQAAYAAGDTGGVVSAAHKLKSSARAVGTLALGEVCAGMEEAGKKGDSDSLKLLFAQFEQEMIELFRLMESRGKIHP